MHIREPGSRAASTTTETSIATGSGPLRWERRITQPALFLTGERDPVSRFMPAAVMDGWVTDLRGAR